MNNYIASVMSIGHTEETATKIVDVIDSQNLLDWSECSMRQLKSAVKVAQAFIANGNSWEF